MKKIIKALLVVMVVVLALTAFVACEQEQKVCQHTGGTATCTEAAVCEICGESYGTALGHKEVKLPAIEATCSKEGRTEGSRCSECKETLVPQETIEKLEHVWVANEDRDFTCELDGFTGGNHCENCGVQDGTVVITPAHCVWGEDYVDVEPTCGKAGVLAHDCTVCGKTEKVADIPATGKHSFTVDVEAKDPTCLPGYTAHKACEVCGARDPETFVEIPGDDKNGHLFEEENYVVYAEPTCTEAGLLAGYCTHCGKLYGLAELPAAHKYVDGVCTECGAQEPAHEHTWADATCTAPKTCETCGATEGEALAHTYVKGICSVCEAKDPAYVDYYLVGYINGADYGCEGDYANLGEYKFVDGKLVATFTKDSYIFVKSGNLNGENVKWYLFESYTTGKEGTLIENKSEKMFIPGNVEVTFTLTVNEDGTLYLVIDYHTHTFGDATCTAPAKCECGATEGEALGHADTNGDYKCDRCSTKMLPADGTALTIPQALAVAKVAGSSYSTQKYYITGIVTNLYNTQYGNFYIKDADGNEICIYGLYDATGKTRYDAMSYKPVEGDEVTVYTVLGAYNTTYQGKNAWLDEVVAHEHDYTSVPTEATCMTGGYTTHTCTICKASYVDGETEALGHTTDNGTCERCGLTIGGDAPVVGTLATFDFGANGSAAHVDGSDYGASKSWTVGSYTLSLTGMSKVFGPAYDAKGNSCLKLGTSKVVGSFSFTVPENVTEVVIYVSGYKAATSTNIKINGTSYTVKDASNNGAYTAITIDTTTTKTITFASVTYRCMINTIVFNGTAN